jgi:hypothetical protein
MYLCIYMHAHSGMYLDFKLSSITQVDPANPRVRIFLYEYFYMNAFGIHELLFFNS